MTLGIILVLSLAAELIYFKIADKCNIIDKPNERSSHSSVVLRGGGIIFLIGVWVWSAFYGFQYPWFLAAVTLAAGISFVDDIRSLPDSVRLVVQFTAMGLMFQQLDILHLNMWWVVLLALIVCVGASNVINFMDGINGITAGYSLAVLAPLMIMNHKVGFMEESFLMVVILSVLVFSIFNFRERGKAKCFAGDVGSVGIAFIPDKCLQERPDVRFVPIRNWHQALYMCILYDKWLEPPVWDFVELLVKSIRESEGIPL